jgi:exonuclease III
MKTSSQITDTGMRIPDTIPILPVFLAGAALWMSALDARPIRIDASPDDWNDGPGVRFTDPAGDALRPGPDLRSMTVRHDDYTVYLLISYARPYPESHPELTLYFDSDDDPVTGFSYLGSGIDLTWQLPDDTGSRTGNAPPLTLPRGGFLLRGDYSPDTGTLELAFPSSMLKGARWGGAIRLAAYDRTSLDRLPGFGQTAALYRFEDPIRETAPAQTLQRHSPADLRLLSWNVLRDAPMNPALEERFGKVLAATRPDIICFQELYEASTPWAIELVRRWLPLGTGEGFWRARKQADCITVSRLPILSSEAVDNNLITEIDTRAQLGRVSWILNAHTPCCENQDGRLRESDRFMARLRSRMETARDSGERPFAIFLVGDMNTGSSEREMLTMTEGWIHEPALHGPSFDPDWDRTGLTDLAPLHTHERRLDTWRSLNNRSNTSRLDYIFFSDSLVLPTRSFVLNTRLVPATFLDQYGLSEAETDGADHLPLVADFRPVEAPEPWGSETIRGSGWLPETWMGPVQMLDFPFLYSARHGWLYQAPGADSGAWFFHSRMNWFWSGPEHYPWIYQADLDQWTRL